MQSKYIVHHKGKIDARGAQPPIASRQPRTVCPWIAKQYYYL